MNTTNIKINLGTFIGEILGGELNNVNIPNVINEQSDKSAIYTKNNNKKMINNNFNLVNNNFNIVNNVEKKLNKYKDKINLIYLTDEINTYPIFGDSFVKNNENNIELIINGKQNKLISKCELKKRENHITLLIQNKLTNLNNMFRGSNNLKDIKELKYLYVNEVKNFSYMFSDCSSLSDIKPLQSWNVSNGNDFSCMFIFC